MNNIYLYIYLDPLKKGNYVYGDLSFDYEPFYVGIGVRDRYKSHLSKRSLSVKSHKNRKIKKILKNNDTPIIIKLYEDLNKTLAYNREIEIIKLIGRYIDGGTLTNQTNGGDSGGYKHDQINLITHKNKIECYTLDNKLYKSYESIKEAADELNITRTNISQCVRYLVKICHKQYYFRYTDKKTDSFYKNKNIIYRVLRIDRHGNQKRYKMPHNAARENNISVSNILSCCSGRYLKGGNYIWQYINKNINYDEIYKRFGLDMTKKIKDIEGNTYLNALDASVKNGHRLGNICYNLSGRYKSVKGKKYIYLNEDN
jgi:hypothetical protein